MGEAKNLGNKIGEPFIPQPYIPADAVSKEARPGYKAGNPLIDDAHESIRRDSIKRRFKEFYKRLFGK